MLVFILSSDFNIHLSSIHFRQTNMNHVKSLYELNKLSYQMFSESRPEFQSKHPQ